HLRLRLLPPDVRLQAGDDLQVVRGAIDWRAVWSRLPRQRRPQLVAALRILKRGRHHARDDERIAVHDDRPTDDGSVAAKMALPQHVPEHDRALSTRLELVGGKRAAEERRYAEDREK